MATDLPLRKEKRLGLYRKGKKRNGKRTTHMMSFSKRPVRRRQIIRIEEQTGRTISCSLPSYYNQ
jgi:hypothetical protein